MKGYANCLWIISGSDAAVIDTPPELPLGRYLRDHFSAFDFTSARLTLPTKTFSGQHTFTVGDKEVELYEVGPAHHVGDLVARVGDVVCTGDVFFLGGHPPHWAGPLQNIINACELVLGFDPQVIIPGHGRPTDQAALEEHLVYLRTVQREVHRCYEAGFSVEKTMDELFQRQDFSPHLGLPERLMIVIAVEYSHLSGSSSPTVLELSTQAAAWSYR